MNKLFDKLIVFILCMAWYLQYQQGVYIAVPVIAALAVSAFLSYFDKAPVRGLVFTAYCIMSLTLPAFSFFLPLICYDLFFEKWRYLFLLAAMPLVNGFAVLPLLTNIFILLYMALSFFMKMRCVSLEKAQGEYVRLRDSTKEFSLQLENQNRELMEKQDYEINLATLNERNRIARDIHDSIGHLLSNSILQTGALMATCKDEMLYERLNTLKTTLTEGMDSIRESIHGLYDESIDLYTEVKALADNFRFCPVQLDYDMEGNPDKKVKYALLSVVKEALSNITRHSDATGVNVTLREHPALYQLTVKDNGSKKPAGGDGIGLKNIAKRVESLKGIAHFGYENGVVVFVSIPKER